MVDAFNSLEKGDVINGFNIRFDLLWVWQQKSLRDALRRGVTIYCGQYVEYLLGGHVKEVQMTSMNAIAEKYGGGCKIDAVKEMWEAGYLTSQIPADLLHDYLCGDGKDIVGDVENTWRIYVGQINRMRNEHPREFRQMLKLRMDGYLATTEMEYNGVYCNTEVGEDLREQLVQDIGNAKETLDSFVPELPEELKFNWGSTTHKSCLIFGGTVKYMKWLPHTDENGNVMYAKKVERWPLFNNEPVSPENCKQAGEIYVLEVEQEYANIQHKGKFYRTQDVFKSGKRAGEGKFKNTDVPDITKPKGAQQPHYFQFDGYTKPLASWESERTDAYDRPLYSTDAKTVEVLSTRNIPFTDALTAHTGMDKDLGT